MPFVRSAGKCARTYVSAQSAMQLDVLRLRSMMHGSAPGTQTAAPIFVFVSDALCVLLRYTDGTAER